MWFFTQVASKTTSASTGILKTSCNNRSFKESVQKVKYEREYKARCDLVDECLSCEDISVTDSTRLGKVPSSGVLEKWFTFRAHRQFCYRTVSFN